MEAEAADTFGGSSPPPGMRRACDQCRLRKIRCDKESPCSNCRSAKRSCSSTGAGQKPKEARQRVLISSQYERKIDQIEERLTSIEALLRNLASVSTPAQHQQQQQHTSPAPSAFSRSTAEQSTGSTRTGNVEAPAAPAAIAVARSAAETLSSNLGSDNFTSSRDDSSNRNNNNNTKSNTPGSNEDTVFDEEDDTENFEGNSSLAAHTAFASEFLADAVQRTSLLDVGENPMNGPKMRAALDSLRQIVDLQNTRSRRELVDGNLRWGWSGQKHHPRTELKDLPLPPMRLVVEKLKEMKHGPVPAMLAIIYCFSDFERFTDHCRRLYFSPEGQLDGPFILVNAGLIYVFFEAVLAAGSPEDKAQYEACRTMCQRNLEIALTHLGLMMPASPVNIEALLMAASWCIDISRVSQAWLYVSRAALMCRTLGWHQVHTMRDDDEGTRNDKSLLFWCTYMLDKALSLRLGRASNLQDYDISLPHLAPSAKAAYPGAEIIPLWIKHSTILGRIYERLYSPGALRQPERARAEHVAHLAADQRRLLAESKALYGKVSAQGVGGAGADSADEAAMFALTLKSDEVSYLAALSLTYRAMPALGTRSRTFSDECIDIARESMRVHQETMEMMGNESLKVVYLHWTILYYPFIPFIVIFCLVIETSDQSDLRRLADFVQSLDAARHVSTSVQKLYQLCQVLYNVASVYIEAKTHHQRHWLNNNNSNSNGSGGDDHAAVGMPLGSEFDMYLAALGFMPTAANPGVEMVADSGVGTAVGGEVDGQDDDEDMNIDTEQPRQQQEEEMLQQQQQSSATTNQLGDWFTGNNYMMGLLEEDLSGFDPSLWSAP